MNTTKPWPQAAFGPIGFGTRFYYTFFAHPPPPASQLNAEYPHYHWLIIDHQLVYMSFFADTGPLHVGCLYRFCLHLHGLLEDASLANKTIVLYSSSMQDKKANSALLAALYAMIVMRWPVADAIHPLTDLELQPFRDAGYARADFHLTVQDVLFGVRKAIDNRLLRLDEFDVRAYEWAEKVENGDWNYITPSILAFASPVQPNYDYSSLPDEPPTDNTLPETFRHVLDHFIKNNIKLVIRLNKKLYDERIFTRHGIEHIEMYFDDGTNPTMEMCREFIDHCERVIGQGGGLAVHCKAGLGRTGTLIGAYLIYKYGFTANEAIGFMRIMRPGSCVGPQQHFLYEHQHTWVQWAAIDTHNASLEMTSTTPVNAPPVTQSDMPLTPPFEQENQPPSQDSPMKTPDPPSTPPPQINSVVPGQPRKTPGTQGRYMVSAPEALSSRENSPEKATNSSPSKPKKQTQQQLEEEEEQNVHVQDHLEIDRIPNEIDENNNMEEDDITSTPPTPTKSTNSQAQPPQLRPARPVRGRGSNNADGKETSNLESKAEATTTAPTTTTTTTTTTTNSKKSTISTTQNGRGKPLHAVADNRLETDRKSSKSLNSNSNSQIPRSKGVVQNLGNLFENMANEKNAVPSTGRYNLRAGASSSRSISNQGNSTFANGRTRANNTQTTTPSAASSTNSNSSSSSTTSTTTTTTNNNNNNNNTTMTNGSALPHTTTRSATTNDIKSNAPSRLPQRLAARRRAHVKGPSADELLVSGIKLSHADKNIGLPLRSTRRRRSSLGQTDVLA